MTQEQSYLSYVWCEKMKPLIRKFVRETVLYGYDKDDLMQECYLQLQKALERYDEDMGVPFESYYKISLYGWRSNESKKSLRRLAEEKGNIGDMIDDRISIEKDVEVKLLFERAIEKLEELNQLERYVLKSYYLENKKLTDIAAHLEMNYKTVEWRKGEALRKLRAHLG